MQLFYKYHHHQIYKLFHTDFWLFELSVWLHVLAYSTISVFIPIFLLNMGWAINQILLYYLIYNLFDSPLNFFAEWLVYKIGARKVIILGTLSYIAFFVCLYNLVAGLWWLFILMALLQAIYDTSYWVSHLYIFMGCERQERSVSRGLSFLYIAKRIAGILAPIIGALILIFLHRNFLILVSSVILLISILPLFKIRHIEDRPRTKPKSFREFFVGGKGLREYVLSGLYSLHTQAEDIIWPIFIYTLFKTTESVAAIPVIVSLTVVVFTYFTGKIKRADRSRIMGIGSLLIALTWVLRLLFSNNIFYYVTVFLVGLFSVLVLLPLDSDLMEKGRVKDPLSSSTYRNFFSMMPRVFLYGFLYLLLEVFKASFVIAAIAMLVIMAVNFIFVSNKPVKVLDKMN